MLITDPDRFEYDEDLYSALTPRNKDVLCRFFNYHCDSLEHRPIAKSAFTQEELRKILASKLENETREFLELQNQLSEEGVRTDPAVEYLAEHQDINSEKLDISTRFELLLLLYEEELIDELETLIIRSRIRSYAAKRSYVLNQELDFSELDDRVKTFHEEWNRGKEDPDAILVDIEYTSEQLVVLKIYQEVGPQYPNTFKFRIDDEDEIPAEPELTQVEYQQLKTIRFQLESRANETELIFTESFNRWRTTLNTFFDSVFQLDNICDEVNKSTSPVAEEIENDILDGIKEGDDPVDRAREKISEKCSAAENNIDQLDVPDSRKDELKDRISTIEISGSEVVDDQSIETQEFRLIAGLDGLFNSVDIEEGFRDMMKKAASDKQAFVLTISNRPVQFSDGTWSKLGPGQLPDKDQRALQIFFDGENGI